MTDIDAPHSTSPTPTLRTALNQRPSFTRWNDPIARLPFLGHWVLSLLLLIAVPVIVIWALEALRLGYLMLPALLLACLPAIQFYWVSARRRLLHIGASTAWALLIVPFWAVSVLNGYDGATASLMPQAANGPTISREVGSLLLLPAVVLHFVLMLRRGAAKSQPAI